MKCLSCKKELGDNFTYKKGEQVLISINERVYCPEEPVLGIVQPYCRKCIKIISDDMATELAEISELYF